MTKPDFQKMSRKELLAYFLQHRDDDEAFYAFMDKLATEPVLATLPPLSSIDEPDELPEVIERIRKQRKSGS